MTALPYEPHDHLPKSLRDEHCLRRDEEVETRQDLYRHAKAAAGGVRAIVERQPGPLTRSECAVLWIMVRQDLRACVRRERTYRPTREGIADETGFSVRTVSRALARLKDLRLIEVVRYAKGGRAGNKGHGLATEFRSGGLMDLEERLAALGYRVGKLGRSIKAAARWAADRIRPKPTGTFCLGTMGRTQPSGPRDAKDAPAERSQPGTTPKRGRIGQLARAAMALTLPPEHRKGAERGRDAPNGPDPARVLPSHPLCGATRPRHLPSSWCAE